MVIFFDRVIGEHFTEDQPPIMSGQTIILAQTEGYTYYVHFPSGAILRTSIHGS